MLTHPDWSHQLLGAANQQPARHLRSDEAGDSLTNWRGAGSHEGKTPVEFRQSSSSRIQSCVPCSISAPFCLWGSTHQQFLILCSHPVSQIGSVGSGRVGSVRAGICKGLIWWYWPGSGLFKHGDRKTEGSFNPVLTSCQSTLVRHPGLFYHGLFSHRPF